MITNIYSDKAIYNSSDSVNLIIQSDDKIKDAIIEIYSLNLLIKKIYLDINCGLNKINIGRYNTKFGGFKSLLRFDDKVYSTSFTIDDDNKVVRYGFLCDFEDEESNDDIDWMNTLNINYVQFYDWGYKPNQLVSDDDVYQDLMGKKIDKNIVRDKINYCREHSMKSMAYGPIYAADECYFNLNKEEGYYAAKNIPLTFIEKFYFMNISLKCNWVNHIVEQYKECIDKMKFSGIHLDTYGYPKRALDSLGEVCHLKDDIPIFLDHVSKELKDASLIFNNVGAWPMGKVLDFKGDSIYVEVWSPYDSFYDLKQIINTCRSGGKSTILAAYIAPFRLDRDHAIYSALLSTFYINTLGSTHLFLGERGCALTQGYYNDYTKLKDSELSIIKDFQDFFVSYEELLYDETMLDVTMSNCGGDNEEYRIKGNYSLTSQSNKISVIIRCNERRHLISLLNLEGNDEKWNESKVEPSLSSELEFEIQTFNDINSIYYATPYMKKSQELDFSCKLGERGNIIKLEVPPFKVGMIIWFEEALNVSSNR
jgi:dextranase